MSVLFADEYDALTKQQALEFLDRMRERVATGAIKVEKVEEYYGTHKESFGADAWDVQHIHDGTASLHINYRFKPQARTTKPSAPKRGSQVAPSSDLDYDPYSPPPYGQLVGEGTDEEREEYATRKAHELYRSFR